MRGSSKKTEVMREVWQSSAHSEAPARWITEQGGDSLLPTRPATVLPTSVKTKTEYGGCRQPPFYSSSTSASPSHYVLLSFLIPFPLRPQPASSFISCLVLISYTPANAQGGKTKSLFNWSFGDFSCVVLEGWQYFVVQRWAQQNYPFQNQSSLSLKIQYTTNQNITHSPATLLPILLS